MAQLGVVAALELYGGKSDCMENCSLAVEDEDSSDWALTNTEGASYEASDSKITTSRARFRISNSSKSVIWISHSVNKIDVSGQKILSNALL